MCYAVVMGFDLIVQSICTPPGYCSCSWTVTSRESVAVLVDKQLMNSTIYNWEGVEIVRLPAGTACDQEESVDEGALQRLCGKPVLMGFGN